jgi:hypothetical protein
MIKFKLYIFLSVCVFFISFGCKKKEEQTPPQSPGTTQGSITSSTPNPNCKLVTSTSPDTNFIPHKKNNTWSYCASYGNVADKNGQVVRDTTYQNKTYFDILYNFPTQHPSGPTSWLDKYTIDSLGCYYCTSSLNNYSDTILLINPQSINGDTIYNNPITHAKVVLINKSQTTYSFSDCYHIAVIRPGYTYPSHHHYKKGLGDLFYAGTLYYFDIN